MAKLVSQSEFARRLNVSRQAVYNAVKKDLLNIITKGRRKYIDLDCYKTIQYIKNDNSQRSDSIRVEEASKKRGIKEVINKKKKARSKKKGNKKRNDNNNTIYENSIVDLGEFDYTLLYRQARALKMHEEAIKRKLENAVKRGELISRERIYDTTILFWDRILTNLKRLADSFLSDIGGQIITAGKVTPKIRQRWRNQVLLQIDAAKETTIKKLKDIEKEQSK